MVNSNIVARLTTILDLLMTCSSKLDFSKSCSSAPSSHYEPQHGTHCCSLTSLYDNHELNSPAFFAR